MKKLRNPGGIEAYFEDDEAAFLLSQEGWSVVDDTPAKKEAPAVPTMAPDASEDAMTLDPATAKDEAPTAPRGGKPKKGKK